MKEITIKKGFHLPPSAAVKASQSRAFRRVFTKNEVESLLADVEGLPIVAGKINPLKVREEKGYRSSAIRWLPEEFGWVYERLFELAVGANRDLWQYDLTGANDAVQFTEYFADEDGRYDWHIDLGDGPSSFRKLSVAVQLNDDYDGGEFELLTSRRPTAQPKEAGTAVVFPSWMLHRVRPITEGVRRSLVMWVCGPPLR